MQHLHHHLHHQFAAAVVASAAAAGCDDEEEEEDDDSVIHDFQHHRHHVYYQDMRENLFTLIVRIIMIYMDKLVKPSGHNESNLPPNLQSALHSRF